MLYNLYVYRTVANGTVNPRQILTFSMFCNNLSGSSDTEGTKGRIHKPRDVVQPPIGGAESLDFVAEAASVGELKALLAVCDADAVRRRLHPQKLLKIPAHLEATEWRQKVIALLDDITTLRNGTSQNLLQTAGWTNPRPGTTQHRFPKTPRARDELRQSRTGTATRGFRRGPALTWATKKLRPQTAETGTAGHSLFETTNRVENLHFLTTLSRGVAGRSSGGTLFSKVTELRAQTPTHPPTEFTLPPRDEPGFETEKQRTKMLLTGWSEIVAGWERRAVRGLFAWYLPRPSNNVALRPLPWDLKMLLGGLNFEALSQALPRSHPPLPARGHSTRTDEGQRPPTTSSVGGRLAPPNPPEPGNGIVNASSAAEEAFLKTHGSVGEIFNQLNTLKHNSSPAHSSRGADVTHINYRDFSAGFKPASFPPHDVSETLRYERNRTQRVLGGRAGNHHKVTVPQQSPPEEVLQRIEQALIVHLGNNYLREVMYSHYGTWLPKYGVYSAWSRPCYNPDALTAWNKKQVETLTHMVRSADWVRYFKYRSQVKNFGEQNFLKQYLFARSAYVPSDPLKKQVDLDY